MKILTLLLPGIGNTLTFTPSLREIRKAFSDAVIDVLVMYKGCEEVLEGNKDINSILYFPFMKYGYLKSLLFTLNLRKNKYDVCITPYPANKFQYNLISFLSGAKRRIAHRYPKKKFSSFSWLQTHRRKIDNFSHEIEENFKILRFLGIKETQKDTKMSITLKKENRKWAEDFIKSNKLKQPIIGIHPGSSILAGMSLKRWPEENFAGLIQRIKRKYPSSSILLFGGKEEENIRNKILSLTSNMPAIVESNTIKDSAALIEKCYFFITNDSGLMHIAAAVNTPTLTITGPTNEKKTVPIGHTTIYKNLDCRPCYHIGENMKCRLKEKGKCLKSITPEEVFDIIQDSFMKAKPKTAKSKSQHH
jgi:heptosyltransferase-2